MTQTNKPNSPSLPVWLSSYVQDNQTQNAVSPSMTELFQHLNKLNGDDISQRAAEIRRLLRNSGFTEAGENRRFQLDPLPYLLNQMEWQQLQKGLQQRIRLLQTVLADLQGPQTLITDGMVAGNRLMRHPFYLREQFSLSEKDRGLFLMAIDVGRDEYGNLYALRDHCQFPRGIGLLLENRMVARRVMSEEFAECGVQRIANFFQQLQQTVSDSTSHLRDPRVVLLSKGPEDPYYSEQAYLATYLGYTLVRSADLTVRKGKVWLKSLDGLHEVDVILRWVEDRYIDSLEQTDFSEHGIPGLLQAVRTGSVKLLNPFGDSLLQVPTVKHALADISRKLFNEDLILKEPESVAVEQIGEQQWPDYELRSHVNPDIQLDGSRDQQAIKEQLQQPQHECFFRRKITLTTAPFWRRQQLVSQPIMLRCFALVTDNQVTILPSALCSTLASHHSQGKIIIKDTWVQSSTGETTSQPQLPKALRQANDLALVEGLIPSRTAESLFWLGSYLERAEDTSRLIRLFIDRSTELAMYPDVRHRDTLFLLSRGLQEQTLIYPYHPVETAAPDDELPGYKQLAHQCIGDPALAGSLCATLANILSTTMQVRELLSYDSLRIVESLDTELNKLRKTTPATATHSLQSALDRIIGLLMAFNGSIVDTMSNSNGSFMLEIGRRVERATQLLASLETLIQKELAEAEQQSVLEAMLVSQVSSVTHRRRYRMYQSVNTAIELVVLDSEYPRSLAYQIEQLLALCKRLPQKAKSGMITPTEKALLNIKIECHKLHHQELASAIGGKRAALVGLTQGIRDQLQQFTEILQTQYFSHTKPAQQRHWSAEQSE